MRSILYFAFFTFVLIACVHQSVEHPEVQFDHSQLVTFDVAQKDASTAKSPALYRYEKNGKVLLYLASKHTVDPRSETFQFIRFIFQTQKIDAVIVEGFETSLGMSPKAISDYLLKEQSLKVYSNGEPSFVIENAVQKNIPFVGGEPSEKQVYRAVTDKGYEPRDLIGFEFIRRIPQLKRAGGARDMASLEKNFSPYSKEKAKELGIENFNFTFEDFKAWYRKKQGKDLSPDSGEQGETSPMDGTFFTQKISKTVTAIRDEHLLDTISDLLTKNKVVFVVYGSSHYRIEERAIEASLGKPTEIELPAGY